ncbi:uncharacterized protein LOC134247365 isoform X2 [Saccostrea cucullata]|uniref:uncharacterized protein LOC134247365 isoform X2 n=1 Tax=Saccostrea cuccullata TaxID=36930 RepID=UPI002ED1974E
MKSIFVLILHICISSSYGLITCDIAKTCTEWKEMKCSTVPCSELNHQIAGTMVDDPKYRRVHATFMSDDWISFVIKWNPPTSLFLKGFRIQIGDGLETSILNNFCLLFPSDRCFVGTLVLKNVTFEIHCNYTGYSSRVDILMNSLPMSDAHKPLPDHLIIERPFKRGQRLTSHYLEDSGQLDYEQFLFKQEYKKECQRNDEEENQPHHTIGLIVLAVIIVILIPILLLLKIKQGMKMIKKTE